MIRKDFPIKLLEYAYRKEKFFLSEVSKEMNFSPEERQLLQERLMNDKKLIERIGEDINRDGHKDSVFGISVDGWFRWLDHEKLRQANKSSFFATIIAIASMLLNVYVIIWK
jgi:hypothetical protein